MVVAGMHRSGTSLVASILADAGLTPPADLLPAHPVDSPGGYFESGEVMGINNGFLAALDRSWRRPEPLPEDCFTGPEATRARSEIRDFLGQHESENGDLLLKDPRFCRLMQLWLPELKLRYERLVVVQVLRRADAVFRSLFRRTEIPDRAGAAITCTAQSDLLWLHHNLELDRYAPRERRLVIAYEDLLSNPEVTTGKLIGDVNRLLRRELRLPSSRSVRASPATAAELSSDRDRVLEAVYQALRGSTDEDSSYLEAAWEHLQIRVPDAHQDQAASADTGLFHRARLQHVTSKCGYRPVFPEPLSIGFLANKLRRWVRFARKSNSQDLPILFIGGNPTSGSHRYRVTNAVEGLHRLGTPACRMSVEMLKRCGVEQVNARCVVIHRSLYDPTIEQLLDLCKRRGISVGFDIDDLVFDADLIQANEIHFIAELAAPERHRWLQRADSYRRVMEAADFCLVPTSTLADQARRINPQVRVIENGFNRQVLDLSNFWRRRCSPGPEVRIGYASGTATHAADFDTVVRPLAETLRRNPEARFTLVGSLDLRPHADLLPPEQVETRPLVEHVNLAHELARFDVNLVPLQSGSAFCDAKSPLKFFEAALAGVPTIAVNNPVHAELIRHGENGLLARSEGEWLANLERLLGDRGLRERQSARAREECTLRFDAQRLAEKYLRLPN